MIICNTDNWPILHIHYPSYPTYDDVNQWLAECDVILAKQQHFVVISTFDENYQFEHEARKRQMAWFKAVKPTLKKYCLKMVRVTQDQELIKKVTSDSMQRNMPFICEIAEDFEQAQNRAREILSNTITCKN